MPNNIQNEVNVISGMTVSNVQRAGTEAQAKAIKLFDWDNDGVLSKKEANCFNSFQVELTKNPLKENTYQISLLKKGLLGENKGIHIDYNNEKDLQGLYVKNYMLKNGEYDNIRYLNYKQISYNATEKTFFFNGLVSGFIDIRDAKSLEVHNSNVHTIYAQRVDDVTITNTSELAGCLKLPTRVYVDKKHDTNLNVDKFSKVSIGRLDSEH